MNMNIELKNIQDIELVELTGEIDANTAPAITERILPLAQPGSRILIDMRQVPYMSSAGLRMLLSLYRQAAARDGKVVLVGLSDEIRDTMTVTGFIGFFALAETVDQGLGAFGP